MKPKMIGNMNCFIVSRVHLIKDGDRVPVVCNGTTSDLVSKLIAAGALPGDKFVDGSKLRRVKDNGGGDRNPYGWWVTDFNLQY